MTRYAWLAFGHLALALGIIGVFVPVLPTTPFLLLASFAYSRGSPRFDAWLVGHPRLGPPVRDWRAHGVIRRRAKVVATIAIVASATFVLSRPHVPFVGKAAMLAVLIPVLAFIWTRPEGVG
jgi:uncharacterized membrane protein YbaN (DUF454 family)